MADSDVPASGARRNVVVGLGVAYTVFAIAALARSTYQAVTGTAPVLAFGLSAVAGVVYVVAAVALRRGTSRALAVARVCCIVELAGVVVVSVTEIALGGFGRATVWSGFGIGYGFLPVILPALGLWATSRRTKAQTPTAASGT